MPTDRWYADRLEELAGKALRSNQDRRYQMPWAESALIPNSDELAYIQAVAPSVIRRILRRARRAGVL